MTVAVDAPSLANALLQVDQTSPIYYLHPSFGLFFEFFEARPAGMVYHMVRSPTNALGRPPMSKAEVEAQHSYLQQHLAAGIERFGLLSAAGSGAGSWIRYARIMGEKEDAVRSLGFKRLAIFRPGIIAGNAHTPGFLALLGRVVPGSFGTIDQDDIGRAFVGEFLHGQDGTTILENAAMRRLSRAH